MKRHNFPITKEYVSKEYLDVLNVIGLLPGDEYLITLNDYVAVQHPPRLIPIKLKSVYRKELQWLCNKGIIIPVQEHTEGTNSIVLVRKADGSLRLNLDPKGLNKNIERNQYYTRTIGDLSAELHGSKYFTLKDAKTDYWIV